MNSHTKVEGQVSISVRQLDDLRTIIDQSGDTIKDLKEQVRDLEGKQKTVAFKLTLDRSSHDYMCRITEALDSVGWNPHGIQDITTQMVTLENVSMLELARRFRKGEMYDSSILYENLEDVQAQLELKATRTVEAKMESLTNEATKARSETSVLRTEHNAKVEDLKKQHKEAIEKLEEEIRVMKGEEAKKSQKEYIAELHRIINQLEGRTWFQKLFNLK